MALMSRFGAYFSYSSQAGLCRCLLLDVILKGVYQMKNKTGAMRISNQIPSPDFESGPLESKDCVKDDDVKKAIENYKCAVNRYNSIDFSDSRMEGILFLERQLAFIGLQLALAKARIRNGVPPNLDYTTFETMLKTLLPNILWMHQMDQGMNE